MRLVEILRINQHSVVIIDSDRPKPKIHLNKTKLRIRDECDDSESHCWITDGREIENYLAPRAIIATCQCLLGKEIEFSLDPYDRFELALDKALRKAKAKRLRYVQNKVRYSQLFTKHYNREDLVPKLEKQVLPVNGEVKWPGPHG